MPPSITAEQIEKLKSRRDIMIAYLKMRVDLCDWHGVMDASVDIREIEAQLVVLRGDLK